MYTSYLLFLYTYFFFGFTERPCTSRNLQLVECVQWEDCLFRFQCFLQVGLWFTIDLCQYKLILFNILGIILYTFIQFHSTPAIVTSVFIGLGIIFCGCAMVHNVFIWQREKTNAVRELAQQHDFTQDHHNSYHSITPPQLPINLNQTQISAFNHCIGHPLASVHSNGPYIIRPATTTPPAGENLNTSKHPREVSGSVSPLMPSNNIDISSVTTTNNSPQELSTLV